MSIAQLIAQSVPQNQNAFMEMDAKMQQLRQYESTNALNDYKVQELQAEAATNNKLRGLYASGVDPSTPEGRQQFFAAGMDPKTFYAAEKERALTDKAKADTKKTTTDTWNQRLDWLGRTGDKGAAVTFLDEAIAGGTNEWKPIRERILGMTPEEARPFIQNLAMNVKDQASQQMEQQKFDEQQKQSGIDNQFQQGQLDVSRGNLAVSQGNAAETRRYHGVMENKPAAGFSMTTDPDGTTSVSYGPGGGIPKLTEEQGKATALTLRGSEGADQLDAIEAGGYRPGAGTQFKQWAGNKTGSQDRFLDPTGQKYEQAKTNVLTAILRKESGAQITDSEWEIGNRQYFAMPGDSDEVIAQKKQNRDTALEGMGIQAGPGRAALPPSPNTPRTPVTMAPPPPMRATNPATGEVIELQGGQWVPVR